MWYPGNDVVDIVGFDRYESLDSYTQRCTVGPVSKLDTMRLSALPHIRTYYTHSLNDDCRVAVRQGAAKGKIVTLAETGISLGISNVKEHEVR